MKQRIQGMVMGILMVTLLMGTVTVFAATTRTIEVTFGNVRTTLWGQEFVTRDANGVAIEAITYNNRVYVPVETIIRAMGANVQWNAATSTLNFGAVGTAEQPAVTATCFTTTVPPFDVSRQPRDGNNLFGSAGVWVRDNVPLGGIYYDNALVFRAGFTGPDRQPHSLHNLRGQYTTFTGYVGRVDGATQINGNFRIYGNGRLLQEIELRATDLPRSFSVDVTNVNNLKIQFVNTHRVAFDTSMTTYALIGATIR